jgi:hypothetical protein
MKIRRGSIRLTEQDLLNLVKKLNVKVTPQQSELVLESKK